MKSGGFQGMEGLTLPAFMATASWLRFSGAAHPEIWDNQQADCNIDNSSWPVDYLTKDVHGAWMDTLEFSIE